MFERKTIQIFYKKLLAFYPRAFRERFGGSMEQIFNDLWNERAGQAKQGILGFVLWAFVETSAGIVREHSSEIKRGKFMENIITNQKSAAIIGFLLAMPLAILLLIEISGIEPLHGFLVALTTEAGNNPRLNTFGKILTLGTVLLLPLGFVISLVPMVRNVRAGYGFMVNRVNLSIAAALFIFIAALVIVNVIDQYPCWIGVPNCD